VSALALAIRWTVATASGFWTDEAEFLFIARLPSVGALLEFLKFHEAHPPLFYLLQRVWSEIWGHSDPALVALPVLSGAALVPVTFVAGRRMFSQWVGAGAAILVATQPFLAHYSAYARPYSTMALLATASVALLWRGLRDGGGIAWSLYAVVTAGMLLTHNWGWLVLGAECLVAAAWLVFSTADDGRRRVAGYAAGLAGVAALYAWWLPAFLIQLGHAGHAARKGWTLGEPLYPFIEFARVAAGVPALLSLVLLGLLATMAAYRPRGEPAETPEQRLALLLCIGVPVCAVTAAGILSARTWLTQEYCLVIVAPLALLAATRGLERLARRQAAVGFLTAVAAFAVIYLFTWLSLAQVGKSNAREFAAALLERAKPSDLLVLHPAFVAPSFNYYYSGSNSQIDFPFQRREEAILYDRLAERSADTTALRLSLETMRDTRRAGRRTWFITRCDWFDFPRAVPPEWVHRGLITADVPLLVTRLYQLRDELRRLYGAPVSHDIPMDRSPKREALCAELYASPPLTS
jgi:uncharacterized membrane protein